MDDVRQWTRYAAMLGMALLATTGARTIYAADQATKTRCATYAQRAVKQYELMQSHPQCVVTSDPLTWQGSYDNHYNGCLLLPASMAKMAESGRDNHLTACGGMKDAAAGTQSASPAPAGHTPANPSPGHGSGSSLDQTANSPAPAGTSNAAPNSNCQIGRPAAAQSSGGVVGYGAAVKDGALSFHSALQNGQLVTYKVVRPAYIVAQMQCTGHVDNLYGQWIALTGGPQGPEIFEVDLGSSVSAAPLSPDNAMELLQK